jgi:hypothetical protein
LRSDANLLLIEECLAIDALSFEQQNRDSLGCADIFQWIAVHQADARLPRLEFAMQTRPVNHQWIAGIRAGSIGTQEPEGFTGLDLKINAPDRVEAS